MSEVNRLRREERELGLQAQELEIEDNLLRQDTISTNGKYQLISHEFNAYWFFISIQNYFLTQSLKIFWLHRILWNYRVWL